MVTCQGRLACFLRTQSFTEPYTQLINNLTMSRDLYKNTQNAGNQILNVTYRTIFGLINAQSGLDMALILVFSVHVKLLFLYILLLTFILTAAAFEGTDDQYILTIPIFSHQYRFDSCCALQYLCPHHYMLKSKPKCNDI